VLPFTYAGSVKALLKGTRTLVVLAPSGVLSKAQFPKQVLDKRTTDLLLELASDVSAGRRGAMGGTLAAAAKAGELRWLHLGVLPEKHSRYNSPARADSIRHVLASANLGKGGKVGLVLVLDDAEHVLAAVNAVGRALPLFSAKQKPSKLKIQIAAVDRKGKLLPIDDDARATVECARESAELVDTPPSDLGPSAFAARARELLGETKGVKVTMIEGDKLLEAGLRGIHAVGRGALAPARMLIAEWHQKDTEGPHVVLVGKGVTFDTGGLHLKPRGSMEGMKADMGGAAAVLGAFRVLVRAGYEGRLSLLLCIAENAVDERSYKPDDILRMHSGKTVEINNTDAEGRLLLADGLSWGARELQADVLIDAATLTGAQIMSTGTVHAAVISNDAELEATVIASGRRSGDLCHPLPFAPELYHHEFRSPVADMRNSVANRMNAQTACAAQFLWSHIEDAPGAAKRRWAHIDLAGPAFPKDRATGFGVALVADVVRAIFDSRG
jgi:probable aminopeptidase NPEPL1